MDEIANKFLLAGNKFMSKMRLRKPGSFFSAYGAFTKTKQWIQNFKETGDSQYSYQNALDNACFQYDMAQWFN